MCVAERAPPSAAALQANESLFETLGDAVVDVEDSTAAKVLPDSPTHGHLLDAALDSPAADVGTKSIYDFWSPRSRAVTLAVVCISQFLNPISQNIILPGLKDMEAAFQTNATASAGVVACFVFAIGISSLAWGPFCDLLGRKLTYLISTGLFAAATVGCIFAQNIQMMLAFRALQGTALGAYRAAGIGSIADVIHPNRRGVAIGIMMMSTLVGPVVGPLLGGFLSQAYGWQAPFYALLAFSAGIIIPTNLVLLRESHQYKFLRRLAPDVAATIREGPLILEHPPKWGTPWAPLVSVCDRRIVLHLLQASVGGACMVSSQAQLSNVLAAPPYNMQPGQIGVAFIAFGAAGMVASPLGGRMFDRAAVRTPQLMARLLRNTLGSLIGTPVGLLLYGWAAHLHAYVAWVLLGLFFINFSMCIHWPAFMSYLSIVKQQEAATASSGQNAIIFCISGALVLAGSAITQALGIGWYMTLLAVMYLTAASLALGQILYVRSSSSGMTALSLLIKSRKGQAMPDNAETRRL